MGFFGWGDLALVVLLPVAAWWLAGQRRDELGVWFIAGMGCFAIAVALNVLNLDWGLTGPIALIRALLYATTFLMVEYFRRLLPRPGPGLLGLLAVGGLVAVLSVLAGVAWGRSVGSLIHHVFMVGSQSYLLLLLRDSQRSFGSRGVLSIALAVLMVLVANIAQIASVLLSGSTIVLGEASPASVFIYLANFVCVVLFSLGYLALRAEIAQRAEVSMASARAAEEERRHSAEGAAEASKALVAERNRLILTQSRFEARNNLAIFNAAVIHEISQPLQKIVLNIESLARAPGFVAHPARPEFAELREDVAAVTGIVHSLRALLTDTLPSASVVRAARVINPIRSIIEAEAALRGVSLSIEDQELEDEDRIEVNPVLFNRVVLNLISNAFQSLNNRVFADGDSPAVRLQFRRIINANGRLVCVSCRDNGLGVPEGFDLSLERVPISSRDDGMGVGLLLSKQLATLWRGELTLIPLNPGLEVLLTLPLVTDDQG